MSAFVGSKVLSAQRSVKVSRSMVQVKAAVKAAPVAVPVKGLDASDKGQFELALHTAPEDTAKHVVHRYMVMFRQNNRAVSRLETRFRFFLTQKPSFGSIKP